MNKILPSFEIGSSEVNFCELDNNSNIVDRRKLDKGRGMLKP